MSQRAASAQLQVEELASLLEAVVDALIVTAQDGTVRYLNAAARNLYGFDDMDRWEQESLPLQHFLHSRFELTTLTGEKVPEEDQPLKRALRGERYSDVELMMQRKGNAEQRVFSFSGTRTDTEPPLLVLTIRDVTERHRAERRYRISFEINPAPTLVARLTDGILVDVNEGFLELTEITKADINGQSLTKMGLLARPRELEKVITSLENGEGVRQQQTKIRRGDGERDVLVAARPITIQGESCGIFTFIDITELQSAQRRLRENATELDSLQQELESVNYGVSHDLRTPLRSIDGFSQALSDEYGDRLDATGRRYLERVKAGAARVSELFDALLEMSRLRAVKLEPVDVDLSTAAQRFANYFREMEPNRGATFEVAPNMVAHGDSELLQHLMYRLLENAWEFTRQASDPHIEVGWETRNSEMVFFVRDNGIGFDERYVGRMFEPFQRLDAAGQGLGVGLAAASRIIQRHDGRIWATGELGKGATFYFALPAEQRD